MEKQKIIFGYNADDEFMELLKRSYNFYKVVLIAGTNSKNKSSELINKLETVVKKLCVIEFPDSVKFNELCSELVKKEITDDVGLVVVLGDYEWVNFVCNIFNNVAYIVNAPSINSVKTNANVVVYDYNRIQNCSLHSWVNGVGEIGSVFAFIIEQVFLKSVYNVEINNNNLIELEHYLFELSNMPLKVFKSKFGKMFFIKLTLKIALCLNDDYFTSIVNNLSNNIIFFNRSKALLKGCAQMYASKILLNAFNFVYNVDVLNELIGFNAFNRLTSAKRFNKNLTTGFISKNFLNFGFDIKQIKNNFFNILPNFKIVLNNYIDKFFGVYKKFIFLQYDKGISHLKFLQPATIINAFNLLPEQSESANFVTFLRGFGFYNAF